MIADLARRSRRAGGRGALMLDDDCDATAPPRCAGSRLNRPPPHPQHVHHPGAVRRDDGDPLRGRREVGAAVVALVAAGIFDGLDGRIARAARRLDQVRRQLDLPFRLHQLRRGARGDALPLDAHGRFTTSAGRWRCCSPSAARLRLARFNTKLDEVDPMPLGRPVLHRRARARRRGAGACCRSC